MNNLDMIQYHSPCNMALLLCFPPFSCFGWPTLFSAVHNLKINGKGNIGFRVHEYPLLIRSCLLEKIVWYSLDNNVEISYPAL